MTGQPANEDVRPGVGQDLKRLRKLKRMTLAEVAAAAGCSSLFLSAVERGATTISVHDLQRVTRVLGVPLSWFFINDPGPPDERRHIVRAGRRREVGSRDAGLVEELLSPDLAGSFEVFRSEFAPGAEMPEAQRRMTEESGYIVSGEFELWLDGQRFHLEPGDNFRFRGEAYRWRNPGQTTTVIIWVIAPPVY